ncbi:MAG: hypothetical protein HDQ88_02375 [Clostridia bacterium]|nr:hypothetical protein [Clostridia bacterium]
MTNITNEGYRTGNNNDWSLHFKLLDNVPAFVYDHPEMVFQAESKEKAVALSERMNLKFLGTLKENINNALDKILHENMKIALHLDYVHAEYDDLDDDIKASYDLTDRCRCIFDSFGNVKAIDVEIQTNKPGVVLTIRKPIKATHYVDDIGDALRKLAAML